MELKIKTSAEENEIINSKKLYKIQKMEAEEEVRLKCVKEGSKLRIKIISNGYSQKANCQFPRDIRVAGREYLVPKSGVTLAETKGKFFYRVNKKNIRIIGTDEIDKNLKVYKDEENTECAICMVDGLELAIISPCGHMFTCFDCAKACKDTCPICRGPIEQLVRHDQLQ